MLAGVLSDGLSCGTSFSEKDVDNDGFVDLLITNDSEILLNKD